MVFSRHSIGSFMSRTIKRYHNSGIWLPGTRLKRGVETAEASLTEDLDIDNNVEQGTLPVSAVDVESGTPSPFESAPVDQAEIEAGQEPVESLATSLGEPGNGSEEESSEEITAAPDDNPPPSLADILANPLPPELSVDNLISESLGNIFQKQVTKDPAMRALLDRLGEVDMRDLAAELKEFAVEIGASEEAE